MGLLLLLWGSTFSFDFKFVSLHYADATFRPFLIKKGRRVESVNMYHTAHLQVDGVMNLLMALGLNLLIVCAPELVSNSEPKMPIGC